MVTLSLNAGCETPMLALKSAAAGVSVQCHPCDEAVVRLLLGRTSGGNRTLVVSAEVLPGTLALS
jgi:hypothetical protein